MYFLISMKKFYRPLLSCEGEAVSLCGFHCFKYLVAPSSVQIHLLLLFKIANFNYCVSKTLKYLKPFFYELPSLNFLISCNCHYLYVCISEYRFILFFFLVYLYSEPFPLMYMIYIGSVFTFYLWISSASHLVKSLHRG